MYGDVTGVLCCLTKHRHECSVNFGGDLLSKFRKLKDNLTFEIQGHYRLEHKDHVDMQNRSIKAMCRVL